MKLRLTIYRVNLFIMFIKSLINNLFYEHLGLLAGCHMFYDTRDKLPRAVVQMLCYVMSVITLYDLNIDEKSSYKMLNGKC